MLTAHDPLSLLLWICPFEFQSSWRIPYSYTFRYPLFDDVFIYITVFHVWYHRVHFVRLLPSYILIIFLHSVPARSDVHNFLMQSLSSVDAWKCSINLRAEGLCPSYQSSSCKTKSWRVFNSIQTFSYHVRILSCILSSFDISLYIHPIQDCVDIHYRRNTGKDTFLW